MKKTTTIHNENEAAVITNTTGEHVAQKDMPLGMDSGFRRRWKEAADKMRKQCEKK